MTPRIPHHRPSGASLALAVMLFGASSVSAGAAPMTAHNAASTSGATAGDQLASRAISTMKAVRTVHSIGRFGAPRAGVTFTGVCAMSEPRALMSFQGGNHQWQILFISSPKKDWERYRISGGRWGPWQRQATGPGDFNFPLLLPLACPKISLREWRWNGTLHFQVASGATPAGAQAWHLRAAIPGTASPGFVDWYVEKGTYRLLRRRYTQLMAKGKPGYVEDASYSAFNAPVTVHPPAG